MSETVKFGVHMLFDAYNCDPVLLADKEHLLSILSELPDKMNMHTISDPVLVEVGPLNHKDPGGLSGFVLIAESHISFHTFPKRKFVTADVYTCQDYLDVEAFTKHLGEAFGSNEFDIKVVDRGTKYPANNLID